MQTMLCLYTYWVYKYTTWRDRKLEYIFQYFQDCEKIHEIDPHLLTEQIDDTVYPQINNDIEYGLFENIIDSYYLDSQIGDDFTCTKACYTH